VLGSDPLLAFNTIFCCKYVRLTVTRRAAEALFSTSILCVKRFSLRFTSLTGVSLISLGILFLFSSSSGFANSATVAMRFPRTVATPLASIIVNTPGDAGDIAVGDGHCDTDGSVGGDQCTLRAAIQEMAVGLSNEVNFSLPANSTIILDAELPTLPGDTTINGPGATLLTVQRNTAPGTPHFRIFRVSPGNNVRVTITGLTITNGRAPNGAPGQFGSLGTGGGGLFNAGPGLLLLKEVVVSGNRAGDGGAGSAIGGTGGGGGGILNSGQLSLINSIVTNNRAGNGGAGGTGNSGGDGGGVTGGSSLTIINSTISNNFAGDGGNGGPSSGTPGGGGNGGGIRSGSQMFIISSTVTGNRSGRGGDSVSYGGHGGDGGGIISGGPMTMLNSTVSNNITGATGVGAGTGSVGGGFGGGIYASNFVTITNSTIVENRTGGFSFGAGGGIYNWRSSSLTLKNTLVANNIVPDGGEGPDLSGTYDSQDYNLIKNPSGASFTGATTHNIIGVDPKLGSLRNNGGPTLTHALLAGSPAINAGSNANVPIDEVDFDNDGYKGQTQFDQRGETFTRIAHGTVDIGAFEQQNLLAVPIELMLDASGPAGNQALAMDSLLLLRDPFPVVNSWNALNPGPDRNTRLVVFITNLQLPSGEPSSSVRINLVDGNNQTHDIGAEDVRPVPNFDFAQVTFRLPDNLPAGPCIITVKFQQQDSNSGSIRIGS
jgi:hypothetical protein